MMCASGYLYLFDLTFLLNAMISINVPNRPVNMEMVRMIKPGSENFPVTPMERPTVEKALNSSKTSCNMLMSPLANASDSVMVNRKIHKNRLTKVKSNTAYALIRRSFAMFFLYSSAFFLPRMVV